MPPAKLPPRLGPYLIKRQIGRGGMGTVYAAVEESTGKPAAVKAIAHALALDDSFRGRFESEINSLKKLRHPNIVELIGYGEQDGHLFYVMELIEGSSLQEELRQGRRFDWRDVTRIAIEICAALKHAHDHGIIHRDLKPANLLITRDDQIKLFDFGIAKLFGSTAITTGSVMGTADYMSPEQGEGKPVGPRSDLYSLGSVMYALLAGRPPFVGKSIPEVVHKVRFERPLPVGRVAHDVPAELERLIDQLLEKDPQKRVPTALALSHRLRAMEHALSVRREVQDEFAELETPVVRPANRVVTPKTSETPTVQLTDEHVTGEHVASVEVTADEMAARVRSESHFTRVSEAERRSFDWSAAATTALRLILAAMLIGLMAGGVWYAHRAPSADKLYQRIAATDVGSAIDLVKAERDIQTFRKHYAGDRRSKAIDEYEERIAIERLHRQLERKASRGQAGTSIVEQLYLEAIVAANHSTDDAADKLSAIVRLYGEASDLSAAERRCIALAQRQLQRLQVQRRDEAEQHLSRLVERLDQAEHLEATDPKRTAEIYRAILRLYEDRSWASPQCDRAHEGLRRLEGK